jgi:hypothetical protein
MTGTEINEDVRAWVYKLTNMTVPEIQQLLEREQIRAIPHSWRRCALAEFIWLRTGVAVGVRLWHDYDQVDVVQLPDRDVEPRSVEGYPHVVGGRSMLRFAKRFDDTQFPKLLTSAYRRSR